MKVYLHTGSNLGNKERHLQEAQNWIQERIGTITKSSAIYETEAWGITEQPAFLNQAMEIESELFPQEILEHIHWIEQKMGRIRKQRWGERIIDIDILFYDSEIIIAENLTIPHPEIQNRSFVLIPLLEIARDFKHPVLQKTIEELSLATPDTSQVRRK